MNRDEVIEILAAAPKTAISIDDTVELAIGAEAVKKVIAKAKRAMKTGSTITWEDGSEEWMHYEPVIDMEKLGSEQFTWDASGDRIKYTIVSYVKVNGSVTVTHSGTTFRKLF